MKKIVCLLHLSPKEQERFRLTAGEHQIRFLSHEDLKDPENQNYLFDANMIIGNPPPKLIRHSTSLELLQLQSAGTNAYLEDILLPGVLLANATGAYGLAISEYMVGMVFQIYKKFARYYQNQQQRIWKDEGSVLSVFGKRVLVVGAGNIGTEFARRMKALGCYTIGVRRSDLTPCDAFHEIHLLEQLDRFLPTADIISLSLPSTPETRNLMDSRRFQLLNPDAILVNVGRGDVLDQDALIAALNENRLYAAALDVTQPEPLPENHPLWQAKNIYITPHISGGAHLIETTQKIHQICLKNLSAYISGGQIINLVDMQTGYTAK